VSYFNNIQTIFSKFVIARFDSHSGEGTIIFITSENLKKKIEKL